MRNAQLQEKLQEMLDALQHFPDDLMVAHYTGLGLLEVASFYHELLNAEGKVASDTDTVNCIVVSLS